MKTKTSAQSLALCCHCRLEHQTTVNPQPCIARITPSVYIQFMVSSFTKRKLSVSLIPRSVIQFHNLIVHKTLGSEYAHLMTPAIILRIHQYLVRESIRVIRCDGWNMVPLSINSLDDIHDSSLQKLLHLSSIPRSFGLAPRRCHRHIYNPVLPHCLFIGFCNEPSLSAFLFEKLKHKLASPCFQLILRRLLCRHRIELADKCIGALLDEVFNLILGDIRKCHVQNIVRGWL